jgi:hypothetical protein
VPCFALCSPVVKFLPALHKLCPLPLRRGRCLTSACLGTQEWPQILTGYGPTPFTEAALMVEGSIEEKAALLALVHRIRLLARNPTAVFAPPVCQQIPLSRVICLMRKGH